MIAIAKSQFCHFQKKNVVALEISSYVYQQSVCFIKINMQIVNEGVADYWVTMGKYCTVGPVQIKA